MTPGYARTLYVLQKQSMLLYPNLCRLVWRSYITIHPSIEAAQQPLMTLRLDLGFVNGRPLIVLDLCLPEAKKKEQTSWQIYMQKHRVEWVDTMRTVFDVVIH